MKLGKLALFASGSLVFMGVIIACSSSDTGTTSGGSSSGSSGSSSGSSGSSSGSSGSSGACSLPAGTYKFTYTKDPSSSANCPDIASTTHQSDGGTGSSSDDAGPGCTTNVDNSTCTATSHCVTTSNGLTTTVDSTGTLNGTTVTGTVHEVVSGSVSLDCKYSFTESKQ